MDLPTAPRPALRRTGPRLPARLLRLAGDDRLVDQVRAGSPVAFEVVFDRHHRGVLAFCRHMLGSVEEAEDAVQHTFMAAYRDLVASERPVQLRPWLYVIARNRCLSVLRARREQPMDALAEPSTEHLAAEVQRRQDLRDLLHDLAGLPADQRAALVLAELGDVSHDEIGQILGCAREKVKALVFQARTSLNASRVAREAACHEIREQLANLRGGSLRRNVLRRHLRECAGCREFRSQVAAQRSALAIVLPVAPSVGLKEAVLGSVLGGAGAGAAAAGGGALAAKALVVAAVVGGGAAGADAISDRTAPATPPAATRQAGDRPPAAAPPVAAADEEEAAERPAPVTRPEPTTPQTERRSRAGDERTAATSPAVEEAQHAEDGGRPPHSHPGNQGKPPEHSDARGDETSEAAEKPEGGEEPKGGDEPKGYDKPGAGGPPEHASTNGPPEHASTNGPPEHSNAGGRGTPPEHSNAGGRGTPPEHSNAGGDPEPVPASGSESSPEPGPPPHSNVGGHGKAEPAPGLPETLVG